ncbi:MAG: hypothetical protein QG635_946 [Bacteroidota bacterium]|nr:hypothetical protein [Bacteroidota bacterium]
MNEKSRWDYIMAEYEQYAIFTKSRRDGKNNFFRYDNIYLII